MVQGQVSIPGTPSFLDAGNPLLAKVDIKMDTGTISVPGQGTAGVVTIRTASTTLTILLTQQEVRDWAKMFTGLAASMSSSGLIVSGNGQLSPP